MPTENEEQECVQAMDEHIEGAVCFHSRAIEQVSDPEGEVAQRAEESGTPWDVAHTGIPERGMIVAERRERERGPVQHERCQDEGGDPPEGALRE